MVGRTKSVSSDTRIPASCAGILHRRYNTKMTKNSQYRKKNPCSDRDPKGREYNNVFVWEDISSHIARYMNNNMNVLIR